MPFAALALAACLLMPRILRDARDAPGSSTRGCSALASLIGLAALTRNEAVWLGARLGSWLVWVDRARRPAADRPRRRCRRSSPRGLRAVDGPRLARVRQPAAGPGARRTPCRSPASTSSPGTTRRRSRATSRSGRRGCSRCASTGFAHNLFSVLLLPGVPIVVRRRSIALPWFRPRRSLRPRPVASIDVPRHEPASSRSRRPGARSSTPPARPTSC